MLPSHLAIIMDGNGRWAHKLGRPRWMGHARGARTVREVVEHCARLGIPNLSLYAFSSDNWKRPREEVGFLFELFASHLDTQIDTLVRHGIRLSMFGRRDRLPASLVEAMASAACLTSVFMRDFTATLRWRRFSFVMFRFFDDLIFAMILP